MSLNVKSGLPPSSTSAFHRYKRNCLKNFHDTSYVMKTPEADGTDPCHVIGQ